MRHTRDLKCVVEDILKHPLNYIRDLNCGLHYDISWRGSLNSCASSSLVFLEEEDFESIFDAIEIFSSDSRLKDQYLVYRDAFASDSLHYNCSFYFYENIRKYLYREITTTKKRSQLKNWFDMQTLPYTELRDLVYDCQSYVFNYAYMVNDRESVESQLELLKQGLQPVRS